LFFGNKLGNSARGGTSNVYTKLQWRSRLWRWKVYWLLLSAALSHGLFAEARTIPLSVDQICFRRAMKAMGTTASIRDFSR
jgi:hypothetical protein